MVDNLTFSSQQIDKIKNILSSKQMEALAIASTEKMNLKQIDAISKTLSKEQINSIKEILSKEQNDAVLQEKNNAFDQYAIWNELNYYGSQKLTGTAFYLFASLEKDPGLANPEAMELRTIASFAYKR